MTKEKIEKLIVQLTLQEKIGMIHGDGFFATKGVERLGIPPFKTSDSPEVFGRILRMRRGKTLGSVMISCPIFPATRLLRQHGTGRLRILRADCSAKRQEGAERI